MKFFKLIEYAYLVVAAFFVEESIRAWSSEDSSHAYLYVFFAAIAVFMFFFKRNFRKRMEQRNQE